MKSGGGFYYIHRCTPAKVSRNLRNSSLPPSTSLVVRRAWNAVVSEDFNAPRNADERQKSNDECVRNDLKDLQTRCSRPDIPNPLQNPTCRFGGDAPVR